MKFHIFMALMILYQLYLGWLFVPGFFLGMFLITALVNSKWSKYQIKPTENTISDKLS